MSALESFLHKSIYPIYVSKEKIDTSPVKCKVLLEALDDLFFSSFCDSCRLSKSRVYVIEIISYDRKSVLNQKCVI